MLIVYFFGNYFVNPKSLSSLKDGRKEIFFGSVPLSNTKSREDQGKGGVSQEGL